MSMTEQEYVSLTEEEYFSLPLAERRRAIAAMLRDLEREGSIEKVRDASGNVVTRPSKYDGMPQVVWQSTGLDDQVKI
jgi:hypothetical protein